MAKSLKKIEACGLRRRGKSIKEIAVLLGVSSGSVSVWTRDIKLTAAQREFLQRRQIASGDAGRMKGAEQNKEKKRQRLLAARAEARSSFKKLSRKKLFLIGLGLYWGEGVKAKDGTFAVTNSDYRVVQLMVRWFIECLDIERERIFVRVYISDSHRDREETIRKYWIKTLGLPRSQFQKMIFLPKGKKVYENHNMYYGVVTLRVARGSGPQYKVMAQIDRIAELTNMPV